MKLIPSLRFNDAKCREALDFYQDCFGKAEIFIQTIGESPMAKEVPENKQNYIMHASFKLDGIEFTASDMMRDKAIVGDNVTLMLSCDSEEEIRTHFEKLSRGGEVFMPVENMFWGALFGVVIDKYGIEWNLNYPIEK